MAYILNGTTLPKVIAFEREYMEKSAKLVTLNNTTKKDITGRKERFILQFRMLTQVQAAIITGIYDLMTTVNFQVTETNLTISATPVHVEMDRRQYNTPGNEYREDITLVLEEVS